MTTPMHAVTLCSSWVPGMERHQYIEHPEWEIADIISTLSEQDHSAAWLDGVENRVWRTLNDEDLLAEQENTYAYDRLLRLVDKHRVWPKWSDDADGFPSIMIEFEEIKKK